jgi:hypothetical protein
MIAPKYLQVWPGRILRLSLEFMGRCELFAFRVIVMEFVGRNTEPDHAASR